VDGESLRPNALSNTKKSFLPTPFAFFALSPIKLTLSSTAQISEDPWSRSGGEAILQREFAARSQDQSDIN